MASILFSRRYLYIEIITLSVVMPLLLYFFVSQRWLLGALWLITIYSGWSYRKLHHTKHLRALWDWAAVKEWSLWRPILWRFTYSAFFLTLMTLLLVPDRWFAFPREQPQLWLMVMILYPLISVIPQEFIFRTYFFKRYQTIFPKAKHMLWVSSLAFGFAHIILQNWVAVGLTTMGGFYFANTYQKRQSLALVSLEHALYGCFIFTIGLGWFFYSGAPHKW